jgi:hypothetical protein
MTDFPRTTANTERLLRRAAAALYISEKYFPCAAKTLAKLACTGSNGPAFRRAGRVPLYPQSVLDQWARDKIGPLQHSTSDLGGRVIVCASNDAMRVAVKTATEQRSSPAGMHAATRDLHPQGRHVQCLDAGRNRRHRKAQARNGS